MVTLTKDGNTVRITTKDGKVLWQSIDQFMNGFTLDKGTMTVSFATQKISKSAIPIAEINIDGVSGITTEEDLGTAIGNLVKMNTNAAGGGIQDLESVLGVGNNADGEKITDLGEGTDPNDAVNKSQISGSDQNTNMIAGDGWTPSGGGWAFAEPVAVGFGSNTGHITDLEVVDRGINYQVNDTIVLVAPTLPGNSAIINIDSVDGDGRVLTFHIPPGQEGSGYDQEFGLVKVDGSGVVGGSGTGLSIKITGVTDKRLKNVLDSLSNLRGPAEEATYKLKADITSSAGIIAFGLGSQEFDTGSGNFSTNGTSNYKKETDTTRLTTTPRFIYFEPSTDFVGTVENISVKRELVADEIQTKPSVERFAGFLSQAVRVDQSGNDSEGEVEKMYLPFATILAAIRALETAGFENPVLFVDSVANSDLNTEDIVTSLLRLTIVGRQVDNSVLVKSITFSNSTTAYLSLINCAVGDVVGLGSGAFTFSLLNGSMKTLNVLSGSIANTDATVQNGFIESDIAAFGTIAIKGVQILGGTVQSTTTDIQLTGSVPIQGGNNYGGSGPDVTTPTIITLTCCIVNNVSCATLNLIDSKVIGTNSATTTTMTNQLLSKVEPMREIFLSQSNSLFVDSPVDNIFRANDSVGLSDGVAKYFIMHVKETFTCTGFRYLMFTQGSYTADQTNEVAIYSFDKLTGTLTQLRTTGNEGAKWKGANTSVRTDNWTTGVVLNPGVYYVAMLYNSSAQVTQPALCGFTIRSGTSSGAAKMSLTRSGQNSLPGSEDINNLTPDTTVPWIALF